MKKFILVAVFMAAISVFGTDFGATLGTGTLDPTHDSSKTIPERIGGVPPIGYNDVASNTYVTVQATVGRELPVRLLAPIPISFVSSGTIDTVITSFTSSLPSGVNSIGSVTVLDLINITNAIATTSLNVVDEGNETQAGIATIVTDLNILNASLSALITTTNADINIFNASLSALVTTTNSDINILNASMTNLITTTNADINVLNASLSASITEVDLDIDVLNASLTGSLSTINSNLDILNASISALLTDTNLKIDILNASMTALIPIESAKIYNAIATSILDINILNASMTALYSANVMASTTVYALTTTADTEIIALTGRTFFDLNSTGTFLLSIGTTPVNASITPCYNYGRNWGSNIAIYVKALATDTNLTVYQGK